MRTVSPSRCRLVPWVCTYKVLSSSVTPAAQRTRREQVDPGAMPLGELGQAVVPQGTSAAPAVVPCCGQCAGGQQCPHRVGSLSYLLEQFCRQQDLMSPPVG